MVFNVSEKNHRKDAPHPCLPVPKTKELMCIQEQHHRWEAEEEEEKRLFWLHCILCRSEFIHSCSCF